MPRRSPATLLQQVTAVLGVTLMLIGCAQAPRAPVPATPPLPPIERVSVADWGGTPGPAPAQPQRITHITLHHQGETWVAGSDVAAYLRRLQQWSRLSKRWADIPYHYVIAPDGRIYMARPEAQAGDTNTEYDPRGHALVMVLGNFEAARPTVVQLEAVVALMAQLAATHGIEPATIASHRDYSAQTVCPGAHLYPYVSSGWLQRAVAARLAGSRELPPLLP